MVCKEDVFSWFKDLESFKRIDVLYNLLNMCLPFELRFIGSCVEEIGKYTYQGLRGPAIIANDIEKLSKDETFNQGILEENVRHRVLLYISLLSSRNYSVANFLYKKLLRTEDVEEIVKANLKDELVQSETLLLFTMALYHPAFTFEQKIYFGEVYNRLIQISESKRIAPKPSVYGYPPGFGYPTCKKSAPEISSIPVKSAPTMCYSDTNMQPPGLPHLPPNHIDLIWSSRPGFHVGAPEVPPFPPPSISPQVSQQGSPSHSRSTSPHRTQQIPLPMRPPLQQIITQPPTGPPPMVVPNTQAPPIVTAQPLDCLVTIPNLPQPAQQLPPQAVQIETLPQSSLPLFQPEVKMTDEELPSALEEKQLREHPWPQFVVDLKPNGMRFPFTKTRPFLNEHMQALSLEGENSLHCSNSSGNSSPNQTPPGTPSLTPLVMPHGPGRGNDGKIRNGPPICDTTSPPPPFSNCSVPYNYPPQFAPNRSIFQYNPSSFRPAFTAPYPTYPTENSFPTISYVPVMYSSHYPPRNPPGCYNCGAQGHVGTDCTLQNIEEITQKKTYQLDYSSAMPDADK